MATLAHNLHVRMAAVKACWPKTTVYWLGDAAHMAEQSDHNPDARGVVHALDVMTPVGPKATAVLKWCLAHPADLEYVIHNRKIYERRNGWVARAYTGSNPHTDHVHISGKHGGTGYSSHTGTGYDVAAENSNPTGKPCGAFPYVLGAYPGHPLHLGSIEPAVGRFQKKLDLNGYLLVADSDFGLKTEAKVKDFQSKKGLTVDGIVGPKTWAAIGALPK